MGIFKLMPLMAVTAGAAANQDEMKAQVEKYTGLVMGVAVQVELHQISRTLYAELASGDKLPDAYSFEDYLRKNFQTQRGSERDISRDFWGTPYHLTTDDRGFEVISAGPDQQFGTDDDLSAGYNHSAAASHKSRW
jgi:hypothetical protein